MLPLLWENPDPADDQTLWRHKTPHYLRATVDSRDLPFPSTPEVGTVATLVRDRGRMSLTSPCRGEKRTMDRLIAASRACASRGVGELILRKEQA